MRIRQKKLPTEMIPWLQCSKIIAKTGKDIQTFFILFNFLPQMSEISFVILIINKHSKLMLITTV